MGVKEGFRYIALTFASIAALLVVFIGVYTALGQVAQDVVVNVEACFTEAGLLEVSQEADLANYKNWLDGSTYALWGCLAFAGLFRGVSALIKPPAGGTPSSTPPTG